MTEGPSMTTTDLRDNARRLRNAVEPVDSAAGLFGR
jgi:hypothetical protein